MSGTATSIQFGDGLNVTDEGSGTIRVDACFTGTGVGIDFNKKNDHDASGANASYLWLYFIGATGLPFATYGGTDYGDLIYLNVDTGSGGQVFVNNGGGLQGFHNTGNGHYLKGGSGTVYPNMNTIESKPDAGGSAQVGFFAWNDGHGITLFRSTEADIVFEQFSGVWHTWNSGSDINGVSHKFSTTGDDFLVQQDQTITRNGSGVITAITPTNQTFRISPGNAPGGKNAIYLYNLPTSDPGLTGAVWNDGGDLVLSGFTAGGVGIDFNKLNNKNASAVNASYLWLNYAGWATPLTATTYSSVTDYGDLVLYIYNPGGSGSTGGMVFENGGVGSAGGFAQNGIIGFSNLADGYLPPWAFMTNIDGVPFSNANHKPRVGAFIGSEGHGSTTVRANGGPIVLDSRIDTILVNAAGADFNGVAFKISTAGDDFLIQSDQTITRNATTGVITAIAPSQPAMRVTPGSTVHVHLYSLPSGATEPGGLTTGDVWRDTSTTPNTLRIK